MDDVVAVHPPIRLVRGTTACYRCNTSFEVAGVVGTVFEEGHEAIALLMYVEELSAELLRCVQERVPTFDRVYSETAGHAYYANICPTCRAFAGDHYLHQPGEVFLPMDEHGEAALNSELLPIEHPVEVRSSYCMSGWIERLG